MNQERHSNGALQSHSRRETEDVEKELGKERDYASGMMANVETDVMAGTFSLFEGHEN